MLTLVFGTSNGISFKRGGTPKPKDLWLNAAGIAILLSTAFIQHIYHIY